MPKITEVQLSGARAVRETFYDAVFRGDYIGFRDSRMTKDPTVELVSDVLKLNDYELAEALDKSKGPFTGECTVYMGGQDYAHSRKSRPCVSRVATCVEMSGGKPHQFLHVDVKVGGNENFNLGVKLPEKTDHGFEIRYRLVHSEPGSPWSFLRLSA